MGNSKIVYYGETLMDLTGDTVEAGKLLKGITAHDKAGEKITGTYEAPETSFADSGVGDLVMNDAPDQSAMRYLRSLLFPDLSYKYILPINGGTFADPYGIKVSSGASLVDTINTLTEPGIYTVYQNRASSDAPAPAQAISSSLRGLCVLSQIKKHYAYILMVDQASNLYVQYIQGDVGSGWKTMFQAEQAADGVKNPNALTIKIGDEVVTYDGSEAKSVEIADGNGVSY